MRNSRASSGLPKKIEKRGKMGKKWQAGSGRRKRKRRSGKNLRRKQAVLPSLEDSGMTIMSVLTLYHLVFLSSHR